MEKEICVKGSVEEETQNSMADSCTERFKHCSCISVRGNFDRNRKVTVLKGKIMSTI